MTASHPASFSPKTILILKPSSLGDIVHTLPAAALLRKRWPEARLIWMSNPEWTPILEHNPLGIEPWVFPRRELRGVFAPLGYLNWINRRNFKRPDLAVDFQGLFRSAMTGKLTNPRRFLGLGDAREGAYYFYNEAVAVTREHAVERYLKLAMLATGLPRPESVNFSLPEGKLPDGIPAKYLLLHPFSRGEGKSLSDDWVNAFCEAMAPIPVVVAGRSEADVEIREGPINLLNRTTLEELIGLLRGAAFVVSVDSGPMHLAAAVGVPLLAVHGWSEPLLVGPFNWGEQAAVWKGARIFEKPGGEVCGEGNLPNMNEIGQIVEYARSKMRDRQ